MLAAKANRVKVALCAVFVIASFVAMINFPSTAQTSSTLEHVTIKVPNVTRIEYVDDSGRLTTATNLGYATVVKDLNDAGQVVFERYYDEQGNPTAAAAGQFAISYDWSGTQKVLITYLDATGAPTTITSGYATRVQEYNESHKIERELYLDTESSPCANTQGEYGRAYEYDADGHIVKTTSLDADGDPMTNKSGYCYVVKAYSEDGTLDTESYYDTSGQPAQLSGGQYAVKYQDGRTISLDEQGNELFKPYNLFSSCPWLVVVVGLALALVAARLPKRGKAVLLAAYVIFILVETMWRVPGGVRSAHALFSSYVEFFSSYGTRVEIVENIWLFVPFGAALQGLVEKRRWLVVAIPLALSVGIECVQYAFAIGTFEFDDMVSNTLGGVFGAAIASCASGGLYAIFQKKETNSR